MTSIPIRDFWKYYSSNEMDFMPNSKIPNSLSFKIFLDSIFGMLTRHHISDLSTSNIQIKCTNCEYVSKKNRDDICETHIGIVEGQIESLFKDNYQCQKSIIGDNCILHFSNR